MARLKTHLTKKLKPYDLSNNYVSYDFIGDIAIIRAPKKPLKNRMDVIVDNIIKINRNIKTVLYQASPIGGDFRLRKLEWIAKEKRTVTIHKEHGCIFKVDLEKCYFSPRLSHERMRLAQLPKNNEVIVNMFSGVGCFSLLIAKYSKAKKIYSIDLNPTAIHYMKENIRLNKVEGLVIPILGDSKAIVNNSLKNLADRVLMPLPEKACEYLEYAILALKPNGGYIHYYDFEHAKGDEDPIKKIEEKISKKLQKLGVRFETPLKRIVRSIGPNWYQVAFDISIIR